MEALLFINLLCLKSFLVIFKNKNHMFYDPLKFETIKSCPSGCSD